LVLTKTNFLKAWQAKIDKEKIRIRTLEKKNANF